MPPVVTAAAGESLGVVLDELLPQELELPYANFAPVAERPGSAQALHRRTWLERSDLVGPGCLVARSGDRVLAAVQLEHRAFESEHFGLAMAKIDRPLAVADPDGRAQGLRALYAEAADRLREAGYAHLAARASTRDRTTPWILQEQDAFQVDTQVSWMAALSGTPHDAALPGELTVEVHDAESIQAIDRACFKTLMEWCGKAFDRGPLVFDHTLPTDRALDVYRAWAEHTFGGAWADAVLVARDRGEVVAFISMRKLPEVSEAAGALVCGRGLGATLPRYRGLFTAIQHEMIARRPLGASFMENETQVATIGSINVYARLGFRYLRSTASFHLRLDGSERRCE